MDTIEKPRRFRRDFYFDISVNTGHIWMGFERDTPEKRPQHANHLRVSDKDLVRKFYTRLLVNNFLTRSLSENR